MSTARLDAELPGAVALMRQGWAAALLVLGAALVVLGVVFAAEVAAAIETWDRSAAYNHCWLVLPVAAWLGWTRRGRLSGLSPAPSALLALPAIAATAAWLVAERLGIMEGRQLAALTLAEVTVLVVLGWRVGRAMAAPLAYLVFLVPFGAFAVPALQGVTAWMIVAGLQLLGIPHFADDVMIELPAGTFLVAEACAGLRFLIASLAFGTLYALVMFRGTGRRLIVLALALVVPVVANGARALGIVLLGHYLGSAEAAAADHLIYGWVFFSVVILLLVAAGLPFRQDGPVPAEGMPRRSPGASIAPRAPVLLGAAGLAVALGALGPAFVASLGGEATTRPVPTTVTLLPPEGCAAGPGSDLRCGDAVVSARLLRFPPHVTWSAVAAEAHRLAGQDDEALTFSLTDGTVSWRGRQSPGGARTVAVAMWRDGQPAGDGLRSRAAQAWRSLRGGAGPVLAVVAVERAATPRDATAQGRDRALLRSVLATPAQGPGAQAAALSRQP